MRIGDLNLKSGPNQEPESFLDMSRLHEDVQVLGVTPNIRVMFEGETASDEKGNLGFGQDGQYAAVEGATPRRQMRTGMGKR
jgi:hypothetical protein